MVAREFADEASFLGRQFVDPLGGLPTGLPHGFGDERRIAADALDLVDHESLDLAGG